MVRRIERPELKRLLEHGAQLVEVLPKEEYEYEHIGGAVGIPLRELDDRAPRSSIRTRRWSSTCNDYL